MEREEPTAPCLLPGNTGSSAFGGCQHPQVKGSGCSWDASSVPEWILEVGRASSGQFSGRFSHASYIHGPRLCPQVWVDPVILFYCLLSFQHS